MTSMQPVLHKNNMKSAEKIDMLSRLTNISHFAII